MCNVFLVNAGNIVYLFNDLNGNIQFVLKLCLGHIMDVDTEWSRVLRVLKVTEDQWVQNVLPKAREQDAIDVIEILLIEACLDVIEENMLTRPKTEEVIVDLHVCIQHVNNVIRDVAIRLGLPITVVNPTEI